VLHQQLAGGAARAIETDLVVVHAAQMARVEPAFGEGGSHRAHRTAHMLLLGGRIAAWRVSLAGDG